MRKTFCMVMSAVISTTVLAGCGSYLSSSNSSSSSAGQSNVSKETNAASEAESTSSSSEKDFSLKTKITSSDKITIRLAYDVAETHPSHKAFVEAFQTPLQEASNGNVTVELYPNGQLGSLAENMESMRIGDLEMCGLTDSTVASAIPEFNLIGLPFLWTSIDSAHEALDGDFGDYMTNLMHEKLGFKNFGYLDVGFRNITNSKKEIKVPDDLKGLKIRTMTNELHVEYFNALGAIPTPMSFTELFTALQQGTVDGQENPTALIYNNQIYEVQKYMTVSEHVWTSTPFVIAENFYNGLPQDIQAAIAEAAANTIAYQREMITDQNQSLIKNIEDAGTQVTELTPDEKQLFQDVAMNSVWKTAAQNYGQNLIDMASAHNK